MDSLAAAVGAQMARARAELSELIAFPSVFEPASAPVAACDAAAAWVARAFVDAGVDDARTVRTSDGSLAVVGHAPAVGADAATPTVLLYSHYDVQPSLGEERWSSSPWTLTERDGRWYGRGSADCKGNVIMHLAALRALRAAGGWPCGIKIVVEGSEEFGGSGLADLVGDDPALLAADAIAIADAGNPQVGRPAITTSLRGLTVVDVELRALAGDVHSGGFGGAAPDPLVALVALLATLHDASGDTTVDGLAHDQRWSGTDFAPERFRADAQLLDGVQIVGSGSVADQVWARPALTITALDATPRSRAINAVPASAAARLALRLAPEQDSAAATEALVAHLRARVPWGLQATITPVERGDGFALAPGGPGYEALRAALAQGAGGTVELLGEGGTIPLCAVLHAAYPEAEILLFGIEEATSRIHAPDESVDPREIERTALAEARFLRAYASANTR
jgi:acetylornithine deacetylase/succinyl-diaminopimelate desuccinylase-like protein